MRVFPRNASMDRKMFNAESNIRWLCIPPVNSAEQSSSWSVVWLASLVKFASVIS